MSKLQVRTEAVIHAPIADIWSVITDINVLHKVNPGVVKATGTMDCLYGTRTCEINNGGRKGTMTEKLIELVPGAKTVWTIEHDTMGMGSMLKDTRFCFDLERIGDTETRVTSETWYRPANMMAKVMNGVMMKRMIQKAQETILDNIRSLTEK
ncbi:SRPBCC family protein [Dinghuibacter silviterrae]|uniref:Polyketide cyclase/dehydrase/lipid transport protein n=1 Tax=Dinghuibacter silviterrae TaxID=1539049 RepID=A0A4R8DM73_9BACT|nr:SRPBCC family protein [Dinghuibacter silviterrae]TDW99061.1 polyketide cyclase/dehydrase/lipid transport protein [Dinghuibacter silviterrae]